MAEEVQLVREQNVNELVQLFCEDGKSREQASGQNTSTQASVVLWGSRGRLHTDSVQDQRETVCDPHRETQQRARLSQPLHSRRCACALLRHSGISNHMARGIFFFPPHCFANKGFAHITNHNAVIADKYRGERHRIKTVSRWHGQSRLLWRGKKIEK